MKHQNSGSCEKCQSLLVGVSPILIDWFRAVQKKHSDAHISCGIRGMIEQEECFERGSSKAHFGQSAHNYCAALDLFQLKDGCAFWNKAWFHFAIEPELTADLNWYGKPGSLFFELPHIEIKDWRKMVQSGDLRLVE